MLKSVIYSVCNVLSGTSSRYNNHNEACEMRAETRLCQLRPCKARFPDVSIYSIITYLATFSSQTWLLDGGWQLGAGRKASNMGLYDDYSTCPSRIKIIDGYIVSRGHIVSRHMLQLILGSQVKVKVTIEAKIETVVL